MLKLKDILTRLSVSCREAADAAGISSPAFSQLVNHGHWPKRKRPEEVRHGIEELLRGRGATAEDLVAAFERKGKAGKAANPETQEDFMLLRRQRLFPETKRHFGLFQDPFMNDPRSPEDVFLSRDLRYVREAMRDIVLNDGFMAVVGESGSGKTTLRRSLKAHLAKEGKPVIFIEPYTIAMEDNDKTGKTLKSLHIAEAIMSAVAPLERILSSPQARFEQVNRVLRESSRAGQSHCLVIEEAHCMPFPTIKHLKRFRETEGENGFPVPLSILLIGQPELKTKLATTNHEVREVVQRCELVEIHPLGESLAEYLKFKITRVGGDLAKIITEKGIEALKARLTGPASRNGGGRDSASLCYPLAVGNLLTAAMNLAVEIGAPVVDENVIRSV